MNSRNMTTFTQAFKTMLPMITGIIPTAVAYALLATDAGIKNINVILSSLIVFAGTVQFLSIELIKQNMPYVQFALIIFLLHARHMFFGISLFNEFNKTGKFKPYMIFCVTDELYAVLTNKSRSLPDDVKEGLYYIFLALIMYLSWNAGTALGVFASGFIRFNTDGMDFALTAMFLVIVVEQIKEYRSKLPFIFGGLSAAAALAITGPQTMLLICCAASVLLLLAARKHIESGEREGEGI